MNDQENLPFDFEPEIYKQLHPDVRNAGVDPKKHYLKFGKKREESIN